MMRTIAKGLVRIGLAQGVVILAIFALRGCTGGYYRGHDHGFQG
jgi:hypothetical protein